MHKLISDKKQRLNLMGWSKGSAKIWKKATFRKAMEHQETWETAENLSRGGWVDGRLYLNFDQKERYCFGNRKYAWKGSKQVKFDDKSFSLIYQLHEKSRRKVGLVSRKKKKKERKERVLRDKLRHKPWPKPLNAEGYVR